MPSSASNITPSKRKASPSSDIAGPSPTKPRPRLCVQSAARMIKAGIGYSEKKSARTPASVGTQSQDTKGVKEDVGETKRDTRDVKEEAKETKDDDKEHEEEEEGEVTEEVNIA